MFGFAFYLFPPTCLINSIKHEHSCKILYLSAIWIHCMDESVGLYQLSKYLADFDFTLHFRAVTVQVI